MAVLQALLLLLAAATLAGLGAGCCWLFVVGPLRQRADDAARLAAATSRAAEAERQLAAEREKNQKAEAANSRRIKALQRSQRIQRAGYERRTKELARQTLPVVLKDENRYGDLQGGTEGNDKQSDHTNGGSAVPGRADDVAVIRLRFSYLTERLPPQLTAPGRRTYWSDRIYLVVERSTVIIPRDQAGDVDEVLRHVRGARDHVTDRERFVEAASRYAGDRIGNSASRPLTQRWVTRDPAHVDAVAQALNRSDEWLHDLTGKPFEWATGRIGPLKSGAPVFGGIGSNLVLQPLDRDIQGTVQVCQIVGIGVGLALGLHPLAISCTKSLLRGQINERISAAIKDVFQSRDAITVDRDPSPARPTLDRGFAPRGPARLSDDRPPRARPATSQDQPRPPRANTAATRDVRNPHTTRDPASEPGYGRGR